MNAWRDFTEMPTDGAWPETWARRSASILTGRPFCGRDSFAISRSASQRFGCIASLFGHDDGFAREPNRLFLRCGECGRSTCGWAIASSAPRVAAQLPVQNARASVQRDGFASFFADAATAPQGNRMSRGEVSLVTFIKDIVVFALLVLLVPLWIALALGKSGLHRGAPLVLVDERQHDDRVEPSWSPSIVVGRTSVLLDRRLADDQAGRPDVRAEANGARRGGHARDGASVESVVVSVGVSRQRASSMQDVNTTRAEHPRLEGERAREVAETERQSAELKRCTTEEHRLAAESARLVAERCRRLAEDERDVGERRREALEELRKEQEELRKGTETARAAAEGARMAAEQARDAAVEAVRATSETLAATLEHMRVVEEMRRFRERRTLNKPN